ncbi:MAG: 4Fe-4S dicluster domain-containing protein [Mycobacterium leprae]
MANPTVDAARTPEMKTVFPAERLEAFVAFLTERFAVYGPVAKGSQTVFGPIQTPHDLKLDYVTTILPPKKFFTAPFETLFHFNRELGITPEQVVGERGRVLFGVHPCDVAALGLLDQVFGASGYEDPAYRQKRQQTMVIALNCKSAGEHCFCTSFGTGPEATRGYDVALTDLGGRYLAEAGTESGAELLAAFDRTPATPPDLQAKAAAVSAAKASVHKRLPADKLPRLLNQNYDHPVWQRLQEECLSCGSCTVVCPTCYCFNVWDKVNLDLTTGERKQVWDSCQLVDFSQVAMGHNFRPERVARVKQRVYHKLSYFGEQYGGFGCVGCGRCSSACIKGIDLTDIVTEIGR